MEPILETLFYGELDPNLDIGRGDKDLPKLLGDMDEIEAHLCQTLEEKERNLFLRFVNDQDRVSAIVRYNAFVYGAKTGGRLMLELT